jgi:hypothetical protein
LLPLSAATTYGIESGTMDSVQSSVIRDYDYDPSAAVLSITFVGGKTYAYGRVPQDVFDAFLAADSRGQFFNRHIRDQYRYWLVTLPRSRSSG